MPTSPHFENAAAGLRTLRKHKTQDHLQVRALDYLTRLATLVCSADVAFLSLIESNRQSVKSRFGRPFPEIPRESPFCTNVIDQSGVLVVEDASSDDRFKADPLAVSSPGIRFFAGTPLLTAAGVARGTLCVIGHSQSQLGQQQRQMLQVLAATAGDWIDLDYRAARLRQELNEGQDVARDLAKKSELLEAVIEGTNDAVFAKDLEGRYLMINRAGVQLLGKATEEVIGHNDAELFPSKKAAQLNDRDWQVITAKSPQTYEHTDDATGTIRTYQTVKGPYLDNQGNLVGLIGISRDITALKEATDSLRGAKNHLDMRVRERTAELEKSNQALHEEITERKRVVEALHSSEERFRLIMENVSDLITMLGTDGRRIYNSPSYKTLFGVDVTAPGADFFDEIHPDDRERARSAVRETVATGISRRLQYRVLLRDGTVRFIESEGSAIRDDSGRISRVVMVSRDITERTRTEEALRDANEQLKRLVDELEQRTRENLALNKMTELLQTCETLDQAHKVFIQFASELFPAESGTLYIANMTQNELQPVAAWGETADVGTAFIKDECVALKLGKVHLISDARSGLLCRHLQDPPPAAGYICAPMIADGGTLGLLYLQFNEDSLANVPASRKHWMDSRQRWASAVAEHLALALANLKLRERLKLEAIHDPLTGLFNKRHMHEALQSEVRRYNRHHRLLGIIMVDIDFFKRFNDKFGHETGDEVLRTVGQFLRDSIRAEDIACRYGGEEFLLIMPEASLDGIQQRAERLREGAKQLVVPHDGEPVGNLTLSLGVAVLPDHGTTVDTLIRAADKALYRAKQEGRDRVMVAASTTGAPTA